MPEDGLAVLPKSPDYIPKWLASTESAEVPLCAQALIGKDGESSQVPQLTTQEGWGT